jgi:hypothetical protein
MMNHPTEATIICSLLMTGLTLWLTKARPAMPKEKARERIMKFSAHRQKN